MSTDFASLTAAALLAIPADQPERLFRGSMEDIRKTYRLLAMRWHPDRSEDRSASQVFQHIARLLALAEERIRLGDGQAHGQLRLAALDGKTYEINYLRRHPFELGSLYVAGSVAAFVVDRDHADLVQNAERAIAGLDYASEKMRQQIAPHLPAHPFAGAFQTADAYVIVMRKSPGLLLLRDVLDHFGGRLDPRHVAWVVSALLNLCCYFQHAGFTHNALSLDTCFMSPAQHSVAVLGGWWYAARAGERMIAAPASTLDWAPHELMATGRADIRTDLEGVRAIGRELLGDIGGSRLAREGGAPQAMVD